MTDRNDGRPRHSASHIHCAVPFFCARSGTEGGGRVAERGWAKAFGEECIAQPAGVHRCCVGERACSERACRCAGAGEGLRRGTGREDDGNASRSQRACMGAARGSGRARGGMGCEVGGFNAHLPQWIARTHIFNIRPPCPRREIAVMGSKRGARVHTSPALPSAASAEQSASRSSSYPQWVIHGKVIHIVARRPVQNVLALAPAHAYI